jgi:post-segregation antitoxin (ccd killing protein)
MDSTTDTSKQLLDYFQAAKPDCHVLKDWKNGFDCRFYFDKNNDHVYILDVSRDDMETGFENVKRRLEENKWQEVLEAKAGKGVSVFKDGAFTATLRSWPKKHTHRRS